MVQIISGRKMKNIKYWLVVIMLGTTGCMQIAKPPTANTQVAMSSVWDMPNEIQANSTFSLAPNYLEQISKKHLQIKNIYQLYGQAISQSLQKEGYQLTTGKADFSVSFAIALVDELNDEKISKHFGVTPGLQGSSNSDKGSFLIAIENSLTKQRIWRGAVQGFVQNNYTDKQRVERAEMVVNMVLKQFYNKS
jgi:hypothetical protein